MRVTERGISTTSLNNLQRSLGRNATIQEQMSSGKVINRPSDSPTGTVQALQLRSENRALQQYSTNANDGMAWLDLANTALESTSNQVNRVRDLVLQGISTGSASDTSPAALAAEVDALRQSLVGVANTSYLGRPIFGGNTAGEAAYDATGAYLGDAGKVMRTVGDGDPVQVNLTGPEAFGTGADNLFNVLASISDKMKNDPAALGDELKRLDSVAISVKTSLSQVGARYNRVESMKNAADNRIVTLNSQLSAVEDIDLPATIMEMQLQQTAYQAALSATAKVIQPSLVDFLR
ncbi:flagellar hook-associated protein FlgL [Spirilliplanes yamanashiensis]|uniref:Flagellar hook-associated protein FlgL n=1 Tax=Spirilliplanes yamanashiensis TaxID=42233 RepID=A0A8J3Y2W1_9ACTN|nr:flagellar hook-associated protein FlgL [Spirilliplanes yamanashiensis]MDP9814366.1 flagellar hook-associated protein 3 FlgL [Spirilliplanes yamanashiensis]GIJ00651.1 flagellar hook-associated protein FlgL [Spirilliplanes yamanashiensis]